MADPFLEGPSPGPLIFHFSIIPTNEPTNAPVATAIQQQQDSNILPWLNFCVYVFFTFLILGLMVYINSKKNPSLDATRDRTTIVSVRTIAVLNAQQQMDQVRNTTQEERMEYVASILKTQKFVDPKNMSSSQSCSCRLTQSSSLCFNKGDSDLESTTTTSGDGPSCAICLDQFRLGDDICSAQNKKCTHEFHLECIFPWLLKSQDCPCCRRDYLVMENEVPVSEHPGNGAANDRS